MKVKNAELEARLVAPTPLQPYLRQLKASRQEEEAMIQRLREGFESSTSALTTTLAHTKAKLEKSEELVGTLNKRLEVKEASLM